MNKIYLSGNYVIVERDGNVYEYPRTLSVYTLEGSNYVIKERIDDGQLVIPIAQIGTYFDESGSVAYDEASLVTFLRENTGFKTAGGGSPADPDAELFITNASITDSTQKIAINQLVVDLKNANLWSKMKAIYPFVGGTATSHKFNLKDPRDLDAAFRLQFFGGVTHSSTGVQGNGTNGYFDTFITLGTDIIKNDNASGVYIRTNVSEDKVDYGVFPPNNQAHQLFGRNVSNNLLTQNSSGTFNSISNTDSRGFFQMTRRNSSDYIVAKNTTKTTVSISSTVGVLENYKSFGLCGNFFGSAGYYSTKQMAFHYYGNTSLTDTELDNMNTAVQAFNTTLSRQV